ncbi:PHP domain-containing protein [Mucilaginibacter sp. ZT4R22]|uniref:PHP domain-containing protein n=1 Tax=Mucilaginibacter pankratovii TaxID=2772110 RepID=A0ABR7WKW3_9SPHI|nr:CehA/McbA family metallohydrolase [Mucilaginibacter pankratovii]MBD1362949.1 PHP domain-containing protein [Mucilaginibacter pankratovii]
MKKLLLLCCLTLCVLTARPQANLKVYYGLLHAHTMLSDGSGTPEEAYAMAKANGLDFFAITEHNHAKAEDSGDERKDGVLIATDPRLYNGQNNVTVTRRWTENGQQQTETISVKPLIKAAAAATTQTFLALYGQEFSTITSGNHVNVFGLPEVITVPNGNFKGFFDLLRQYDSNGLNAVVQLNHPDVHKDLFYKGDDNSVKKNMYNDYGIDAGDLGPDFDNWVKTQSQYTHLIEVLTGPALSKVYRDYKPLEEEYFFYLKQGLRISPTAGQDNHYRTWGSITDARTGVLSESLSEKDILNAFRNNRTFATEDKNLKVVLQVNDATMGSAINATAESELKIKVSISDTDEPNATYDLQIVGGAIKPELSTMAIDWKVEDGILLTKNNVNGGDVPLTGLFAAAEPSFYYIRITQNSGQKKDRAWTAPVWVNLNNAAANVTLTMPTVVPASFYWTSSSSSQVYHKKGCRSIDLIKPENLRSGDIPPAGRTLHACVIETNAEQEP